jgi:hypothetical protein
MAPDFGKSIHQLPLIPANVLKKHCVHEPLDPRFRSAARMLQALWREDRAMPIGSYVNEDGKRRKLGSRISEAAGRAGGNFLTPEIAHIARREAAYREVGAMIDAERLATNLLSSMPLTFNLLAPWGHSLERASGYLLELLPAFTGTARQLPFEHSPGRGNPEFTGDYTAFDALIRYSDAQGRNGFVAFELKYSESMREPMPELKSRYAENLGRERPLHRSRRRGSPDQPEGATLNMAGFIRLCSMKACNWFSMYLGCCPASRGMGKYPR